jgi:hypothetical protein
MNTAPSTRLAKSRGESGSVDTELGNSTGVLSKNGTLGRGAGAASMKKMNPAAIELTKPLMTSNTQQ